ncbi:MAG TPA: hypothetical protein PLV92_06490, partial [Pirellulaceae bacterium]|nr:hypothetical protein [Pirellulaceae bacterium]
MATPAADGIDRRGMLRRLAGGFGSVGLAALLSDAGEFFGSSAAAAEAAPSVGGAAGANGPAGRTASTGARA